MALTATLRIWTLTPMREASKEPLCCSAWKTPLPTVPPPIIPRFTCCIRAHRLPGIDLRDNSFFQWLNPGNAGLIADQPADRFQFGCLLWCVLAGADCADPDGSDDFVAFAQGDAERPAHSCGAGAGTGDSARVGLQIAHCHRAAASGCLPRDALSDGNRADGSNQCRWQAGLGRQMEHLGFVIQDVDGSGF